MELENKKQKLKEFALSVLTKPEYRAKFDKLLKKLSLTEDEVVDMYVLYDLDIFAYGNEIYDSTAMRVVLYIKSLLDGGWNKQKQDFIAEVVTKLAPSSILELGFGIPAKYVIDSVKQLSENSNEVAHQITLTDYSDKALDFASYILENENKNWDKNVVLSRQDIKEISEMINKHDLIVALDSLEHVENPTYVLHNLVENSNIGTKFLISLPISEIIPMHYIAFPSDQDVRDWLNDAGLTIILEKEFSVNREIDLFADQLDYNCVDLVVLCYKDDGNAA